MNYFEKLKHQLILYSLNDTESCTNYYQSNARIYLDEYSEQEELRKEWFKIYPDCFKHIYTRFLRRN